MKKWRFREIKSSTQDHKLAELGLEWGLSGPRFSHCGLSSCFPTLVPTVSFILAGFPTSLSESGPHLSQLSYGRPSSFNSFREHISVCRPGKFTTFPPEYHKWAPRSQVTVICSSEAFSCSISLLHSHSFKCLTMRRPWGYHRGYSGKQTSHLSWGKGWQRQPSG